VPAAIARLIMFVSGMSRRMARSGWRGADCARAKEGRRRTATSERRIIEVSERCKER
jgi:hypothetical protein